jgi:hypothetical protein
VLPPARRFDLGSAAAVVDDDDLFTAKGVEQPPERVARAIGDRDDRCAQ